MNLIFLATNVRPTTSTKPINDDAKQQHGPTPTNPTEHDARPRDKHASTPIDGPPTTTTIPGPANTTTTTATRDGTHGRWHVRINDEFGCEYAKCWK